jgi:hypothetical protein
MRAKKEKKRFRFSPEQLEELKRDYHNTRSADLADRFGCTVHAIYGASLRLGLKKDVEFIRETARNNFGENHPAKRYQIKKGTPPANKGKKQADYMTAGAIERTKATRFKTGHLPHNARPAGFERIDKDGYVLIKVPGRRKLVFKHRYVWEQQNGAIPEGFNIQFKDGDRRNCAIENLYMISRAEQMKEQNSFYVKYPEEVHELIRLKGVLKRQINKQCANKQCANVPM